ncbi:MAG: RNA methyltransferase [Fibrobacter sp.]|nr:RNA methyltransferase [Fibrobacter sp.]
MNISTPGYFGIGIECCKTWTNYGTLWRTAHILGASFVFLIGKKFQKSFTDTSKAWRSIPTYSYETVEDLYKNLPYSCPLIGIEMTDDAQPLETFTHPQQACYLLGSEDHGLSKKALELCHRKIRLRGEQSMNVAVAGSILMYHRIMQRSPISVDHEKK